jgi:ethanolamine permease
MTSKSSSPLSEDLGKAKAGPVLLTGLGLAYLCVGGYVSWGYAIGSGGVGGALAAFGVVLLAFFLLTRCMGELSSMMPSAGGGFEYVSRGLGANWGRLAAAAIVLEYVCAGAALAAYCASYFGHLLGVDGFMTVCVLFTVVAWLHMRGVSEALVATLIVTVFAISGICVFLIYLMPQFNMARLLDIPVQEGNSLWFPNGLRGTWAALPFVVTFFITIEGIAFASEEAQSPEKNIPKAMLATLCVAGTLALALLVVGPGAVGAAVLSQGTDPITTALSTYKDDPLVTSVTLFVTIAAITALIASFFGGMHGTSRLLFHLSREGLMPQLLGNTNRRGAPSAAIVLVAIAGLALARVVNVERLLVMFVFGATVSYLLIFAVHFRLRIADPRASRPYRSPGGLLTPLLGFLLAVAIFVACFLADVEGSTISVGVVALLGLAFFKNWAKEAEPGRRQTS